MAECLDVARQLLMQQRITSSESLSLELFSTGLRLARNLGLVDPGGDDLAARRAAFADELRTLVRRLRRSRRWRGRPRPAVAAQPEQPGERS